MKKELDERLVRRFPVLYQDRYSPMSHTCMCWGFPGDGWFDILWQLSLAIEDELGYSRARERWFLFKKKFARRWNDIIYRLSPVRQRKYKMEGKGTKDDPMHQVLVHEGPPRWDEKIGRILFGWRHVGRFDCFCRTCSFKRLGIKHLVLHVNTGFTVDQVKEKFGTLRFYCSTNDRISQYVRFAETLSALTCEECGKPGRLGQRGGWYRTTCKKCAPEGFVFNGIEED